MSPEERNTLTAIVCAMVVLGGGALQLTALGSAGQFLGPDAVAVWAREVLWLMVLGIGFTIAVSIVVAIAAGIATRGAERADLVDERDRMIRGWGTRVTMVVSSAGFLLGVAMLAIGWTVIAGLNTMLAAFAFGALAGDLTKLVLYRRGM